MDRIQSADVRYDRSLKSVSELTGSRESSVGTATRLQA
jgi:hypothetical protein